MHHSNENSTKYFGIFSALQYATEINFFLLVSIFVLFVDNFFIKIHHYGLVQFSKQYETISINPIEIITIFIAFLFTTSIILPTLKGIADSIYPYTIGRLFDRILTRDPTETPYDMVNLYQLEKAAHANKDKYLLDLCNEYKREKNQINQTMNKRELYAFSCLINLCWNYYPDHHMGISHIILHFLKYQDYVLFLILGLLFLTYYRFEIQNEEWIYCPTLYQELHKDEIQEMYMGATKPFPNKFRM